jgi:hypothetical protein
MWPIQIGETNIMHNKYTRDDDTLRAWLSASHIERTPQKQKEPAPTPPAATKALEQMTTKLN